MDEIAKIINQWDPVGLFPMAPDDEYKDEIKELKLLLQQSELNVEQIAHGIEEIFIAAFGDDMFKQSRESCIRIATQVIDKNNESY